MYESQGKTDEAIAAYEKAIELDPDDEAGVKSTAESRIEALEGTDDETDAADAATDDAAETEDTADDGE